MAVSVKNKLSKQQKIEHLLETHKQGVRSATIQGVAQGYRALSKLVVDKINQGYTIEQIKAFCENVDKEYEKVGGVNESGKSIQD